MKLTFFFEDDFLFLDRVVLCCDSSTFCWGGAPLEYLPPPGLLHVVLLCPEELHTEHFETVPTLLTLVDLGFS
jgi:hypothetical protein